MAQANYPICECPEPSGLCCGGVGPAVFSVKRDGKKLKLCTRCDGKDDTDKKVLPWVAKAPAKLLMDFDPLGGMCLAFFMADQKKAKKK